MKGVVARDDCRVDDLLQRVLARLASLELHDVEHLGLAVEQEIVETENDPRPLAKAPLRPRRLSSAGALNGSPNVISGALGYLAEHVATERGVYRDDIPPTLASRALTGQPIEQRPADGRRGSGGHHLLRGRATRRARVLGPVAPGLARKRMITWRVGPRPRVEPDRLRKRASTEQEG